MLYDAFAHEPPDGRLDRLVVWSGLTMNQESVPGMQVTLDTSVLLEYWKDQAKRALVERLLVLAREADRPRHHGTGPGRHPA